MKVSPWRRGCRFRPCSPLLPLLLSLPLVAGLVSEAQAQTTFVKNTGQTTVSNTLQSFTRDTAQAFTTGGNAAGYKLTSVVFKFLTLYNNSPSFTVAIYTDSSGSPGNSLGTLTNPALSTGDDVEYTFTASGQGIDLEANTQYWIVIDNTSTSVIDTTVGWAITASDSEDAGAASGWSIANSKGDRSSTSTGSFTSETDVLQIEIIGTAKTANTAATGAPTITGTATQGQTLTANAGNMADPDGLPSTTFPSGYTFQWKRGGTAITGATSRTYTLVQADVGQNISVTVSFTDGGGNTESLTSTATGSVANVNDAATGAPTITGTATQGQTLTANAGNMADPDGLPSTTFPSGYTFQWKRGGTAITGATSRTYTLVQADVGQNISVTVSFTDGGGNTESLTSTATGSVANVNDAATGAPTITGTATQGQTLTADTSGIADPDGLGSFSYQWKRGTTSISGATSSTYTLVGDDVGQTITVTVSWNDGGGTSESLTSAATAQVAAGVTVSFKESAHEVEEGDAVTLTLQLSQSLTTAVTINVVLTGITAGSQGTDFDDSSRSVSIPSGTTEVTFDVTTVEDPYDEEDETFRATIVAANLPAGVNRGTPNHSTVTIQDDDAPIKIFWEEATWNIAENAGTAYLLMQATRTVVVQAGDELEVNYSLSGTATCGTDYTITGADCDGGGGVFTIPAGTAAFTNVLFPITLIDDNVNDNGETIIVTLKAGTGYKLGTIVVGTVTTYDDTGSAAFSISGTPRIGETLTVVKDSDDPDGNGSGMFSYSWQFRATSSDAWNNTAAINRGCSAGATCTPTHSATYPTVGGQFRAVVSYADGNGLGTTIFTSATNSFLSARTEHTLSLSLASGESSNLDEGGDPVELVISGTPPLGDYSLFVTLGLGGTATRADHMLEYEVNPGEWQSVSAVATPRFDMNSLPAKLRVTAVDDGAAEGSETIAVTLGETPDRYQFGYSCPITPEDPSLGCIDEHGVDQSVSPPNAYVVGASSSVSLTIRPSEGPPNAAPTVDNPIPDQSATAGEAFSYAFAATAFSDPEGGTLTYTATKGDGAALPPWLTFTPSLRIFSGTPGSGDAGTVSVKVTATDSGSLSVEDTFDITVSAPPPVTPVASFGSAASSAGEDGGTQNVQVNLSPAPQSGITVAYTVGGTATAGTDFSIANSGSVQVAANATSVTIPVTITEDTDDEANETVVLTLVSGTGYTVVSGNVHTLTINDNEDPPPSTPVVSIGVSPSTLTEGATARFTLTASPAPTQDIVVAVTVAGGSFATGGPRTVTVGTSGTASFTVATTDDGTDEPNGTITATVNTGTGYAPHNTEGSASVTVNDNDNPGSTTPVASFGSATSSTAEDGGTQNVRVNLSPAPQSAITVAYTVGGTATAGTDFSIANSGSVQVAANVTSVSIPVTITEDTDDEANETVILTLGSGTGYRVGSGNVHTLTITDNDDPGPDTPVVSITASPSSMTEGDTATFTLTASPAPTEDISVQVEVTDSGDFASGGAGPQTVSIPPLGTASFTVVTTDDDTDEPNGTITVTVDTGTGYSPHNTEGSASVTVNDNDNPGSTTPVASFGSATSSAGEDGGTRNVAVNLSPAPQSAITLSYTVGGTATAGTDFSIANSGSVQVAANVTSVSIPVTITEDTDDEANETVILTLGSGTGYRVGSGNVHTLTINDNNDPGPATPVVSITGSLPTLTEGDTATFSLTASPAPTEGIVVAVTVAGGSFATGGPRTVTVGTTGTASFTVVTTDDETDEPNGTITATVNTGTGYAPSNTEGSAAVTVNDNDDPPPTVPPTVSISSERAISEGDDAVFTLSATPAPREDLPVTVQVMDSGDFASGGAGLRTVSIPPSGIAVFTVPTMDDNTDEPNGTITATVNTGTGYLPHNTEGSASVTVNDNDVPGLRFSPSSLTVARGGSSSYTISLSTRPSEPVTVSIRVPEGSGLTVDTDPGRDGNQTTLTFRADDWNVPQRVVVTVPEHPASITLTHTATGDHYGGVTAAMTVRVAAIDPAAVRGWHVRWGRTLSQQVVDALQDRFAAVPTPPGLHLRVAGEELTRAVPLAENRQVLAKALGFETVTAEQLVEGSAFSFSPPSEDGTGPGFALWGRGALSSFRGQEDTVSQEGEVSTALVGAEWRAERWQAGAALSRSWGSGSYGGENSGEVDRSTMTGLFPYGRYALTPRLGIWAVAGWGWGQLSLQPDGTDREYQPWSKLSMTAVGLDGLLLDGGAEGLSLVSTAEVLRVRTVSEGVADLAGSEGILSRRRLGLEATRAFPLSNGAALSPSLSVGIREDGGDAETGFGLEMGAGLSWNDPGRGIRGELQGRSLLSHVEEDFREQGLALSFAWDPTPGNRGPSLSLSHAVGATAAGGMDALLQPVVLEELDAPSNGQQFAAELAYGVSAFADRLTLSPGVGLVLSPDGAVYSLGWALAPYAQQAQAEPWELALQGEREQRSATTSAEHSLTLRFSLLF